MNVSPARCSRILPEAMSRGFKAMQSGAQGVKIRLSGRIGGAGIARSEWMKEGRIPLHTLRNDIDYGFATADTSFVSSASRYGCSMEKS